MAPDLHDNDGSPSRKAFASPSFFSTFRLHYPIHARPLDLKHFALQEVRFRNFDLSWRLLIEKSFPCLF